MTPRVLRAQEPFGFEFRVNTYTTGTQRFGSIAGSMNYLFVVTWESAGQDGSQYGIFGQRYSSDGVPLGTEFRVNTYATGNQRSPAVGGITSQFTIVWQSDGQDGSGECIFGQRYTPAGSPAGPEFRVNTYTSSNQSALGLSSSGFAPVNLVVLWQRATFRTARPRASTARNISPAPASRTVRSFGSSSRRSVPRPVRGWRSAAGPAGSLWTSAQDPDGSPGVYSEAWFDLPAELQTFTVQ